MKRSSELYCFKHEKDSLITILLVKGMIEKEVDIIEIYDSNFNVCKVGNFRNDFISKVE